MELMSIFALEGANQSLPEALLSRLYIPPTIPTTTFPFAPTTLAKSPFEFCVPAPKPFVPHGLSSFVPNERLNGRSLRQNLPLSWSGVYLDQGLGEGESTRGLGFECVVVGPPFPEIAVKEPWFCPA